MDPNCKYDSIKIIFYQSFKKTQMKILYILKLESFMNVHGIDGLQLL